MGIKMGVSYLSMYQYIYKYMSAYLGLRVCIVPLKDGVYECSNICMSA